MTRSVCLFSILLLYGCGTESEPECTNAETQVFAPMCAQSSCHSTADHKADLDMQAAGLADRLVGMAAATPTVANGGMCGGQGSLLDRGSNPATGLFLKKLGAPPPCGARMPQLLAPLNASQMKCVQDWANAAVIARP